MSLLSRTLRQRIVGRVGIAIVLIGPISIALMGLLILGRLGAEGLGTPPLQPLLYSLGMVGGALGVALPISMMVGIYLAEYPSDGPLGRVVKATLRWLRHIPSPLWGLWAMGLGLNLFTLPIIPAATLALGAMLLPHLSLSVQKAFEAIPWEVREGGLVLGASRPSLIQNLLMPLATPRIIEVSLFSAARALGETAILVMVSRSMLDEGYIPGLTTAVFGNLMGSKGEAFDSALAPGILWLLVVGLCGAAFAYRHLRKAGSPGGLS